MISREISRNQPKNWRKSIYSSKLSHIQVATLTVSWEEIVEILLIYQEILRFKRHSRETQNLPIKEKWEFGREICEGVTSRSHIPKCTHPGHFSHTLHLKNIALSTLSLLTHLWLRSLPTFLPQPLNLPSYPNQFPPNQSSRCFVACLLIFFRPSVRKLRS